MRRLILVLALIVWPLAGSAQDDKDWLTRTLQDALSSAGRQVTIEGFRGALASRAEIDRLSVSDDGGPWLVLEGVVMSWNRAALLSRRIEIAELTARRIEMLRPPLPAPGPVPEAAGFSLPELPVSVEIGRLGAETVALGASVLGQPVELAAEGALSLAGGEGRARLNLRRTDGGPAGRFELDAGFSNSSGVLDLDLALEEDAGGLAARLIGLPGEPALGLSAVGRGPLDSFAASIRLESGGAERLAGKVVLGSAQTEDSGTVRTAELDLSGDLAPLLAPAYQPFFGDEMVLRARARRHADGRTDIEALQVKTAALGIDGDMRLDSGGLPESFALSVDLSGGDGPVVLPLSGPITRVGGAALVATYDSARGANWTVNGELTALQREGLRLDDLTLAAEGTIDAADGSVQGNVTAAIANLAPANRGLAEAIGPAVNLAARFSWRPGAPLTVPSIALAASGLEVSGQAEIADLAAGGLVTGALTARIDDLARLSTLAGRPLGGRGALRIGGSAAVLGGSFDADLGAELGDLTTGWPTLDTLAAGSSSLTLSARRDGGGITLRALTLKSAALHLGATGRIASGGGAFDFEAAIDDAGRLVAGASGPVTANGTARGEAGTWTSSASLTAPDNTALQLEASMGTEALPRVRFAGATEALARILPGLTGSVTAEGALAAGEDGWQVSAELAGTAGAAARIEGTVAGRGNPADLTLAGQLPLAAVNRMIRPRTIEGVARFDLHLAGPLAVSSLSGRVTAEDARLSAPTLRNALTGLSARADIAAGAATVRVDGRAASGGKVAASGRVSLGAPFDGDLAVTLRRVGLSDARLYDSEVTGDLTISGPLAGGARIAGALALGTTELTVPSTGFGAGGIIPDIAHVGETAAGRATRQKAGLLDAEASGQGPAYTLDLAITAARRVFLRGRGIDAELGGAMRLGGTTAEVVPEGQFDLIRGRLDILGRRFALQEGNMRLEGSFVPTIRLLAQTRAEDTEISVLAEGPANSPQIRFVSRPELPEEEILARLLFGRDLGQVSPLQAAQLASAIATLSGRGGMGALERLRRRTGFDNLDITTGETGQIGARLGKYLGENVYSEVTVGGGGETTIDLNLDVSPEVTLKGSLGADGSTGIGIFFQRDY